MSANVGLSTPRGSGTSGYVQRNLSSLKPRQAGYGQPYNLDARPPRIRKPDEDILRHDRLREIEVKVAELQDKLEEEGKLDEDEIEEACDKERERLTKQMSGKAGSKNGKDRGKAKTYQVHELAEAKAKESEKLRRALGLKAQKEDEGNEEEHPMARQERRKREAEMEREKLEQRKGDNTDEDSDRERYSSRRRRSEED